MVMKTIKQGEAVFETHEQRDIKALQKEVKLLKTRNDILQNTIETFGQRIRVLEAAAGR